MSCEGSSKRSGGRAVLIQNGVQKSYGRHFGAERVIGMTHTPFPFPFYCLSVLLLSLFGMLIAQPSDGILCAVVKILCTGRVKRMK